MAAGSCANAIEKHKETLIRNILPTRLYSKKFPRFVEEDEFDQAVKLASLCGSFSLSRVPIVMLYRAVLIFKIRIGHSVNGDHVSYEKGVVGRFIVHSQAVAVPVMPTVALGIVISGIA